MKKYDSVSEAEVLYHMISEGVLLPLDAEDFGSLEYKEIFRVLQKLSTNKKAITEKSVIDSLKKRKNLLSLASKLIMSGLPVKNIDIRIKSLKDLRGRRELTNTNNQILDLMENPTVTTSYIAEQAIEYYKKIAKIHGGVRNLTGEIRELIGITSGNITTTLVHNLLQTVTSGERKKVNAILHRMEKEGLLEKTGRIAGEYRIKEHDMDTIDWQDVAADEMRFDWPMGIGEHYRLFPKNIVTVAGETDAGKTAFALNVAALNAERYPGSILYFSSEMGNIELRSRLEEFAKLEPPADVPLELWDKIRFYERVQNFQDVIEPEAINIVDYLELHEDFFKVGKHIKEIFDRLTTGMALILIQKKKGADYGYGAELTVQKARLAINLENDYPYHRAIFSKLKNRRHPKHNPNGLEIQYSLLRGAYFKTKGGWSRPTAEELQQRKKKGKKYGE